MNLSDDGPGPVGPVGPDGVEEQGVAGSGVVTSDERTIPAFDALTFSSEGDVVLTQTDSPSLTIQADDNLHSHLSAEVVDGVLQIASDVDIAPSSPIVFLVGVGDLERIELAGAGSITATDFEAHDLTVALSGVGDIVIDRLQTDRLVVEAGGVGTIHLGGEAATQEVKVTGVGGYDGAELLSTDAAVTVGNGGEATVWVTEQLSVTVSGSGAVSFYGSPAVESNISDTGSITQLGEK